MLAVYHCFSDDLAVSLEVAAECKAGADHPWVAFYDNREFVPGGATAWLQLGGNWPKESQAGLAKAWLKRTDLFTDRLATHAVSALGKDSRNSVREAAQQALSFARARVATPLRYGGDPEDKIAVAAIAPVVVTQAPLFTCELLADGEVSLRRVERFDMFLVRNRYEHARVYVRSEAALPAMAEALGRVRGDIATHS